jgi:multiple sugar transport system substrate-binding protein
MDLVAAIHRSCGPVTLANGLRNVPTLTPALSDPTLTGDRQFGVFLKIYANPGTASTPITAAGSANQDLLGSFVDKYQAGSVPNLAAGLTATDAQIDAQLANSGGGGAP